MAKLCVAADKTDIKEFWSLVESLQGQKIVLKVGLQTMPLLEPKDWKKLKDDFEIFVDAKLHDIPSQVAGSVKTWQDRGADYLTLHLSGAAPMLSEAAKIAKSTKLLGVSILTSLDSKMIYEIGFDPTKHLAQHVCKLVDIGWDHGIRGFVSSVAEVEEIKQKHPNAFCVNPGIHFGAPKAQDQSRSYSVAEAKAAGSDLLVVGRAITGAAEPSLVCQQILKELS